VNCSLHSRIREVFRPVSFETLLYQGLRSARIGPIQKLPEEGIARRFVRELGRFAWIRTIAQNRGTIFRLLKEALGAWRLARSRSSFRMSSMAQR
jgi:hypothetical protein